MNPSSTEPSEEDIAQLARKMWQEEGEPEGKADEHWARAREQLKSNAAETKSDSGTTGTTNSQA